MCESSSTSITITPYEWVSHRTSRWHMSIWSDSLTKKQAAYLKTLSYEEEKCLNEKKIMNYALARLRESAVTAYI
jgi:hypothetical protein